ADGIISKYGLPHEESATNAAILKDPVHGGSCREKRSRHRIQLGSAFSRSGVLSADNLSPQNLAPPFHRVRSPYTGERPAVRCPVPRAKRASSGAGKTFICSRCMAGKGAAILDTRIEGQFNFRIVRDPAGTERH